MGRAASCVSWFLVAALSAMGLAQSPDPPRFCAGTTLVEFTVVVTGEDGRHVTDLKQEDVSIVEGGRLRDVAFFHYEGAQPAAIRVRAQPLPPGVYTNRPEYAPGPPRNITAILIDSLNTRAEISGEGVRAHPRVCRRCRAIRVWPSIAPASACA